MGCKLEAVKKCRRLSTGLRTHYGAGRSSLGLAVVGNKVTEYVARMALIPAAPGMNSKKYISTASHTVKTTTPRTSLPWPAPLNRILYHFPSQHDKRNPCDPVEAVVFFFRRLTDPENLHRFTTQARTAILLYRPFKQRVFSGPEE